MNFSQKIKGGALQYVLVVSVIIAIIILSFISLIYLEHRLTLKHGFSKEVIANTQMGFDYLKGNTIAYDTETTLKISDNLKATTKVLKKHWGVFDLAIVSSKIKNEDFQKIGLLGTQNAKREALYLKDNNQSLILVGKTKITGDVSIPKQGVKSGNIAGTSYYGNTLIYGSKKTSTASLPKIKNLQFLKDFYKNYDDGSLKNFELENDLKLHQPFAKNTLVHENSTPINLANITLSGQIIIVSKTAIKVEATAILEDVILIAPTIDIEPNVRGNFQAIATKNITVHSNCLLRYPSALIVLEKETKNSRPNNQGKELHKITIQEQSELRGIVLFHSESKSSNYKSQVSIQERAIIRGEVYCSRNLEMQGTVFGSVFTNNFIVNQSGSIYINHLYNGVINSKELASQYAGLQINQETNGVAKWVD